MENSRTVKRQEKNKVVPILKKKKKKTGGREGAHYKNDKLVSLTIIPGRILEQNFKKLFTPQTLL